MGHLRLRLLALVLAVAVLAAACGGGDSDSDDATTDNGSADTGSAGSDSDASGDVFTAAVLGGGELSSASFEGQDTVLWFWAPWCTICRAEAPDVVAASEAVSDVEVIGVAGRGEVDAMDGFVADTDTGALTHVVDDDGSIWSTIGA